MESSDMTSYTVVAAYAEPVSLFCTTVEAASPADAITLAWDECREANWSDAEVEREEEWADVLVIKGEVEVIA